jgi:hypothetical protein
MSFPAGAPLFADGDTHTLAAAGGDVATFEQNVVAPGCIALTAPKHQPVAATGGMSHPFRLPRPGARSVRLWA